MILAALILAIVALCCHFANFQNRIAVWPGLVLECLAVILLCLAFLGARLPPGG